MITPASRISYTTAIPEYSFDPEHDSECIPCEPGPEEHGEPHMCHQADRLLLRDGLIVSDTAWCGGRWGAALQAKMAEAAAGG